MLRTQASLHCTIGTVSKTTMWIVLFFVSCTSLLVKGFGNEEILGKGRWSLLNIMQCEEPEQYEVQIGITQRKINRSHDALNIYADFDRELDVTYGIELIANKEVDGGYKFYQQLTDESLCNMATKYMGSNWQQILTKANIDPPECPIPVGEFIVNDFVVDYRDIEETGMYGKYDACVYITYMGQRVACARCLAQFEKQREEDDDDDDY